jgi:hypothetical protein
MSGWNSLQSVDELHSLLQGMGCLIAAFVIAAGVTAHYFQSRSNFVIAAGRARDRYLPYWRIDIDTTLHNAFVEIAILGTAALLALAYAAHAYGQRKAELVVATHASEIGKVRSEAEALHRVSAQAAGAQADARLAAEIAELQKRARQTESRRVTQVENLRWEVTQAETRAEVKISRLERELAQAKRQIALLTDQRRLTMEEKDVLVETLRPFAGQKVSIAAINGTDDDRAYVTDFVEVFEAAGWDHPDVSYRRWDRDPVGVEITLNEADGRAGRVNVAIGTLINVVRKLGLTDGNTIYMTNDIPTGQVAVKIGKKLMR